MVIFQCNKISKKIDMLNENLTILIEEEKKCTDAEVKVMIRTEKQSLSDIIAALIIQINEFK